MVALLAIPAFVQWQALGCITVLPGVSASWFMERYELDFGAVDISGLHIILVLCAGSCSVQ